MARQRFLHALLLLLLPLVVAWFDLSVAAALLLVLLAVVWRQLIVLSALTSPSTDPELVLETIQNSHFAEKGRWCLDRLGVPYEEKVEVGVLGIFLRGRTVPMLRLRTGRTRSSLCESSHVLRYLYGRYAAERPEQTAFLKPTVERLDWEQRLDRYGVQMQVWIYHHLLKDPALCKQAWGAYSGMLPSWQRWSVLALYPLLESFIRRAFQPDEEHYARAVERIEAQLTETEAQLADGRPALLGGDDPDFVDLTLASLSALWTWPEQFSRGRYAEDRVPLDRLPPRMRADMDRWREDFPATAAHVDRLYAEQRMAPSTPSTPDVPQDQPTDPSAPEESS